MIRTVYIAMLMMTLAGAGDDDTIRFDRSRVPSGDAAIVEALSLPPSSERGVAIDAPFSTVEYLFTRPTVAWRIMTIYNLNSVSIDLEEAGGDYAVIAESGSQYNLRKIWSGKDIFLLRFTFYLHAPLGPALKTSGSGIIVLRLGGDAKGSVIDYDLYFAAGKTSIDQLTKNTRIQPALIMSDLKSVAKSFTDLCETVSDDPESVLYDMKIDEEYFTGSELDSFRKALVKNDKRPKRRIN